MLDRLLQKLIFLIKPISIFACISFVGVVILLPVIIVIIEAFKAGVINYFLSLNNKDTIEALLLSLKIALYVVIFNTIFGIMSAWCLTRFNFYGKSLISALIDIPFSVSPVIVGFIYLSLFNTNGLLGHFCEQFNIQVLFNTPALVLVTIFVTFPFVTRELVPLMAEQGADEEVAALMLGSSGIRMFFTITIPKIKTGLIYGILLANARALGEFGAVAVVSGHIKGLTDTVPLRVEMLYNEYQFTAAFALASILIYISILFVYLKNRFFVNY